MVLLDTVTVPAEIFIKFKALVLAMFEIKLLLTVAVVAALFILTAIILGLVVAVVLKASPLLLALEPPMLLPLIT